MNYPVYTFHWHASGVVQDKILLPASVYEQYMALPYRTKDEQKAAKKWLKGYVGRQEWFTDDSPLFRAIETGVCDANGIHRVTVTLKRDGPVFDVDNDDDN